MSVKFDKGGQIGSSLLRKVDKLGPNSDSVFRFRRSRMLDLPAQIDDQHDVVAFDSFKSGVGQFKSSAAGRDVEYTAVMPLFLGIVFDQVPTSPVRGLTGQQAPKLMVRHGTSFRAAAIGGCGQLAH
jgi:hypothetical protein